jgi:hypothetical protein
LKISSQQMPSLFIMAVGMAHGHTSKHTSRFIH